MEYRALGKTGMNVSVLSYGASPLGSGSMKLVRNSGSISITLSIRLEIISENS